MKLVIYEDKRGYLRRSMIKDRMDDSDAHLGIPDDPPDLSELDWQEIEKELHNLFVKRDIISIADTNAMRHLSSAILSVVQPKVVNLYKQKRALMKKAGG